MKNPFSKLSDKMDLDEYVFILKKYSNYKDVSRQMKFVGRTIDGFDKNKQEYAILETSNKEKRLAAYNLNYGKKNGYIQIIFNEYNVYICSYYIEIGETIDINEVPIIFVKEYLSK